MNNEEHLVVLKDPGVVRTHQGWFEYFWAKAEVQTAEIVSELFMKQKIVKEAKKGPSRSPSVQQNGSYASISSVPEDVVALVPVQSSAAAAAVLPVSSSPLGSSGRAALLSLEEAPVRAASKSSS